MENTVSRKMKDSNLQLLKIIAMFLIVLSHVADFGGFNSVIGYNFYFLKGINLGNLGIDILILITGYYACKSTFSVKKLVLFISQVWFYSVIIFLISAIFKLEVFSISNLLKYIFPLISKRYWLFTCCAVICIFSPYINSFLSGLKINQYNHFIITMLVIFGALKTLVASDMYCNELVSVFVIYCIGFYFAKYPKNILTFNKTTPYIVMAVSAVLMIASIPLFDALTENVSALDFSDFSFHSMTAIPVICFASSLFAVMLTRKPKNNEMINSIAETVAGVYLIHCHPCIREKIWQGIFKVNKLSMSPALIIVSILGTVAVFVICFFIEYARKKYIESSWEKILENYLFKKK